MFVDEGAARDSLARMVRRLTANVTLREDLLQEALVHLWLTEISRPSQTKSWYLQSCKYHLLHYLASGRSVDSAKRRKNQLDLDRESIESSDALEELEIDNPVFTWVSARDIISLLSCQLSFHERAVLNCFAEGMGPREIGRKLRMSHTMVIKHRRKIACLFNRLEPPAPFLRPAANGNGNGNGNGHPSKHVARALIPGLLANGHNGNGHSSASKTNGRQHQQAQP